jgi:transcriptional regulator with XRE-family HTH domain
MINHKLRVAREQRRWTMAVAAEKIGVTEQTYSSWESGKRIPHLSTLDLLCQAFDDLSPEELGFGSLDQAPKHAESSVTPLSESQPLALAQRTSGITVLTREQVAVLSKVLGGAMKHFDPAKRATLEQLLRLVHGATGIALATPLQGLVHVGNLLHEEEIISTSAAHLPILWRLYFDGHIVEVELVLRDYLSSLSALAEQPSEYQKEAASFASKAHQLACMITLQPQDYTSALVHADQAIQYARIAEDPNVHVAALIRKALVYFYLNRPTQRLWVYQEAEQLSSRVSPLLQGRVYIGLAEAHSSLAHEKGYSSSVQEKEALYALERSYAIFPAKPIGDPHFSYTHFTFPKGHEGLMYLNLNRLDDAWNALVQKDKTLPQGIIPERVELSVRQAKVSLARGVMEQTRRYLESAATSALALGSKHRYNEAWGIYQQMQEKWPNEQDVKDLADLFR